MILSIAAFLLNVSTINMLSFDRAVAAIRALHERNVEKHLIKPAFGAIPPQMARRRSHISHFDHVLILLFCSRPHISQSFHCIKNSYIS
jgi:hypothetical protein